MGGWDEHQGHARRWEVRRAGPANAPRTVLFLPGALCSGEFYEDVFAESTLGIHVLAVKQVITSICPISAGIVDKEGHPGRKGFRKGA
jgi:hypothetical protein